MKNLWPESFSENDKMSAKQVLEEQANLLPKLTGDLVYAEVTELDLLQAAQHGKRNDFVFRFDIKGKFLEDYRFQVFSFSHDITLYPVLFKLDELLGKELHITEDTFLSGLTIEIEGPEQLEEFVSQILQSKRVSKVIGSIMSLTK